MTLLVDPPLLLASGYAVGTISSPRTRRRAAIAVGAGFLTPSVSLYLNAPVLGPFWRACGARSGKDLILNSWVFHFDSEKPSTPTDLIAGAIFATYPAWLILGISLGKRARNRHRSASNTGALAP